MSARRRPSARARAAARPPPVLSAHLPPSRARSDDYPRHHEYHEGGHGGYHDRYHDHHAYDDYHHRYDEPDDWQHRMDDEEGLLGGEDDEEAFGGGGDGPEVVSMHEDKHLGEGAHAEFAENDEGRAPGHEHE